MYIHSKYFIHKLKYVAQAAGQKKFPEFYKYVAIEYNEAENALYMRSFNGEIHLSTKLGLCEDDSVKLGNKNEPIGAFDYETIWKSWSKVDDQIKIQVNFEKSTMRITSARAKSEEVMMTANGFVDFPDYGKERQVPAPQEFADAIEHVLWAADPKNIDVRCQGIFLTSEHGFLEVAATDRNTMAMADSEDNPSLLEYGGLITIRAAAIIKELMGRKSDVEIATSNDGIAVYVDDDEFACTYLDEEPLKYNGLIQHAQEQPDQMVVRLSRDHLIEACQFIQPYTENDMVQFKFSDDEIIIFGQSTSKSKKSKQQIPYIADEGDPKDEILTTTTTRMLSCIKDLSCSEITMSFPEKAKTLLIYPTASGSQIEVTILSILLMSQEEIANTPAPVKKRKVQRRGRHRDEN